MTDTALMEQLAAIEHQRWSDWQAWCHQVLREHCPSPELETVLERWDRQIATPYDQLTEREKEEDRKQVRRYWDLIRPASTPDPLPPLTRVRDLFHDAEDILSDARKDATNPQTVAEIEDLEDDLSTLLLKLKAIGSDATWAR